MVTNMKREPTKVFAVDMKLLQADRMHSYTGRILNINLTNENIWVDEPSDEFYRKYIGGRGMILYYLLSVMPAGVDPLGSDNLLIFASGILTGTVLPGTGRHAVGAKSPLTGALASSEAGGWWGTELKKAGFDAIIIHGKASQPVYLWIKNGRVEIYPAMGLWGLKTGETQQEIRKEFGDEKIRVAQIGPAGENLVRYAAIMHDINRAAGRSGLGAVMGSKNLKAIAVRGTLPIGLADRSRMDKTMRWITGGYKDMMGWAISYGTPGSVAGNYASGATGIRNYLDGMLEGIESLQADRFFPEFVKDRDTCSHCPVRCKLVVEVEDEEYPFEGQYGGPEYESIGALGPLCAVTDPVTVAKANELCAAYGLDTISTGGTIAFTMECASKGLLPAFDFVPRFGDGGSLVESVHRIASREGIGEWMAEGSARMAENLGPEAIQMLAVARNQELPLHDPRLKHVMAMGYALSATGADHMHNYNDSFANFPGSDVCARLREMGFETPLPLFGLAETKLRAFMYETAFKNFLDCAVICHFYPYEYHHMVEALSAVSGWEVTREEVNEIGTRIITMARLFLLREGFTAKDDRLSARAYYILTTGPNAGRATTPKELSDAMQVYFSLMGWDQQGVPGLGTINRLGIADIKTFTRDPN